MTDTTRPRYRRRPDQYVVAVQLNLQTEGFTYRKWGAEQHCKPGDWLVDNQGDVYTVDADTFAHTYRPLQHGAYLKTAPVWAEQAEADGSIATKEGRTHYRAGDFIVFNQPDGSDGYAMAADKFHRLYEPDR